jgi:hypothetical protein
MSLTFIVRNEGHEASAIGVEFFWRKSYGEDAVESGLVDGDEGVVAGGARARQGGEDGGGEMSEGKC